MELWILYTLIAVICVGTSGFLTKVFAEKNLHGSLLIFVQGFINIIGGSLGWVFSGQGTIISSDIALPAFLLIFTYFWNIRARILSLQHITTGEYFIGYRFLSTTIFIFIGLLIFHENISYSQYFGIFIGFVALVFLYEKPKTVRSRKSWMIGIMLLIMCSILIVLTQVIAKFFATSHLSIFGLFIWQGIFYLLLTGVIDFKQVREVRIFSKSLIASLGFLITLSSINLIGAISNTYAYEAGGNLSIVMKMISYSLFIPIILSHFVYKEPITWKKWIAFILTIISIWYLI